jgi:hypothetical protein
MIEGGTASDFDEVPFFLPENSEIVQIISLYG